jgi:CTP synthase
MFCNVGATRCSSRSTSTPIYRLPLVLAEQGLDDKLGKLLNIWSRGAAARRLGVDRRAGHPAQAHGHDRLRRQVRAAGRDATRALNEALLHGGIANDCKVEIRHIDSELIERRARPHLADVDGILVAPGFGARGTEGKIAAVQFAREAQGAVLRHLLRHADGGDRVRAQRAAASTAPTRPRSIRPRRTRSST